MKKSTRCYSCIVLSAIFLFVYIFFFFPKRTDHFENLKELEDSSLQRYKEYPFLDLIPLIPANSRKIKIFYRINRLKNITISFQLDNELYEKYIEFITDKLESYRVLSRTPGSVYGTLYFQGIDNATFRDISVTLGNNEVTIESF